MNNRLLWHIPEDFRWFKKHTAGHPVVMGRRTWESLPRSFRPLPGRRNVVITRNPAAAFPGATAVTSLESALRAAAGPAGVTSPAESTGEIWVIGGGAVYAAALAHGDRVVITELAEAFDGDTFAPDLGPDWREAGEGEWLTSRSGLRYRIRDYARVGIPSM
jgi:dihydrofolate reductase